MAVLTVIAIRYIEGYDVFCHFYCGACHAHGVMVFGSAHDGLLEFFYIFLKHDFRLDPFFYSSKPEQVREGVFYELEPSSPWCKNPKM